MIYTVGNNFVEIIETSGTIQNTSSIYTAEISDNPQLNSGILIYPLQSFSFSGNIYVRCIDSGGSIQIRASPVLLSSSHSTSADLPASQDNLKFSNEDLQKIFDP